MSPKPTTILALSAHQDRIGFCFLVDRQPVDWKLSFKGAFSPPQAREKVREWLEYYQPDIVVTEDLRGSSRKGKTAQGLILAIGDVAIESKAQHIEVERYQPYGNKYEQIARLVQQFPAMQAVAPAPRRIYEKEPSQVTIFEALAMALQVSE